MERKPYVDHFSHVLVLTEGAGQHRAFSDVALKWLIDTGEVMGFTISVLNNAQPVTEQFLSQFQLIIQLDFPPYTWPKEAEQAFVDYIDNGKGGWIGFHHATLLGEFDGYPL